MQALINAYLDCVNLALWLFASLYWRLWFLLVLSSEPCSYISDYTNTFGFEIGKEGRGITCLGWKGSGSLGFLRRDHHRRRQVRRWMGGFCLRRRRPWRDEFGCWAECDTGKAPSRYLRLAIAFCTFGVVIASQGSAENSGISYWKARIWGFCFGLVNLAGIKTRWSAFDIRSQEMHRRGDISPSSWKCGTLIARLIYS